MCRRRGCWRWRDTGRHGDLPELLARARTALALGEQVVLDASWRHEAWRAMARQVAADTAGDLVELLCQAPPEVASARIAARRGAGGDLSDATAGTLSAMTADFDRWPEAAVLDTSHELARSLASALTAAGEPGFDDARQPAAGGNTGSTVATRRLLP